jgi:hypothetical protein
LRKPPFGRLSFLVNIGDRVATPWRTCRRLNFTRQKAGFSRFQGCDGVVMVRRKIHRPREFIPSSLSNEERPRGERSARQPAHRQNHRSATTTVSPGLRNVPGGTTACAAPSSPTRVSLMALRWARGVKPPAIATALSAVMFGT